MCIDFVENWKIWKRMPILVRGIAPIICKNTLYRIKNIFLNIF